MIAGGDGGWRAHSAVSPIPAVEDGPWTRRRLVTVVLPVAVFAAACRGDGAEEETSARATATPGGSAARQPNGELKIAIHYALPSSFDPTKAGGGGYSVLFGVGETLTRLTPDLKVEPWLAERVAQIDLSMWQVTLRPDVTFHDGSPMSAEDVAASFRRVWETQPAAARGIPKETQIAVRDPRTLTFTTPKPIGTFPNALTSREFVTFKETASGFVQTGPYRPVRLEVDKQFTVEAYAEHWGGPPPIDVMQVRMLQDPSARVLALQAGDVDLITGLAPEQVKGLPSDIEPSVVPGMRVNWVVFNHQRPLFGERAVREAFALGIDRAALNKAAFDGQGTVVGTLFPPDLGVEVVPAQSTDVARARPILDEAGWRPASDGVRVKEGRRLAFTLYSSAGSSPPTTMAQVIQAQLKPLGFDIQVQERQDYDELIQGGEWDAAMTSWAALPTGDPFYLPNVTHASGGVFNDGKYTNAQLDRLVEQMQSEPDPARRSALSRQVQEIIKSEVPNAYLVAEPRVEAFRKGKLKNYVPHPNDLYFIDNRMSVT